MRPLFHGSSILLGLALVASLAAGDLPVGAADQVAAAAPVAGAGAAAAAVKVAKSISLPEKLSDQELAQLTKLFPDLKITQIGRTIILFGLEKDVADAGKVFQEVATATAAAVEAAANTGTQIVTVPVPLRNLAPEDLYVLAARFPGVTITPLIRRNGTEFDNLPQAYRDTNVLPTNVGAASYGTLEGQALTERLQARQREFASLAAGAAVPGQNKLGSLGTVLTLKDFLTRVDITAGFAKRFPTTAAEALGIYYNAKDLDPTALFTGTRDDVRAALVAIAGTQTRPQQVSVEARILELSPDAIKDLGVLWADNAGKLTGTTLAETKPMDVFRFGRFTRTGFQFTPTIKGLIDQGKIRIRANPGVVIQDKQQADIFLGEQVTIGALNAVNSGNLNFSAIGSVTAKIGIQLYVKPEIKADPNTIDLRVISSIGTRRARGSDNFVEDANFSFQFRKAETSVTIKSGETVVLAGLKSDEEIQRTRRVPILGQIPGIGELFTDRRKERRETEYVVLITARAITEEQMPRDLDELILPGLKEVKVLDRSVGDTEKLSVMVTLSDPASRVLPVRMETFLNVRPDQAADGLGSSTQEEFQPGELAAKFSVPHGLKAGDRDRKARIRVTVGGESREVEFTINRKK